MALCTCYQALIFTSWLLTDCRQSCLEKMISFRNTGPQIGFTRMESASELPGRIFKLWASGVTSLVFLTHVSLPRAS